jgi:hypothetical protein
MKTERDKEEKNKRVLLNRSRDNRDREVALA